MDEQTRIDLARAERARLILEDELVQGAFGAMRALVSDSWANSPARDAEGREHLWKVMKVIGQFEAAFKTHMETGQIAAHALQAEEERKTLMERIKEKVRG